MVSENSSILLYVLIKQIGMDDNVKKKKANYHEIFYYMPC